MRIMKIVLAVIILLVSEFSVYADSPLTSTEFYVAYQDYAIVNKARQQNGVLTEYFLNYIVEHPKDYAINLAIINAIGWDYDVAHNNDDNSNYTLFETYLKRKFNCNSVEVICQKCDANILMCLAYNKALTYYFDVTEALDIAAIALKKDSKSRILNIIYSLIYAQDADWSKRARVVREACFDNILRNDCNQQTIDIVWDYMKSYEEYEISDNQNDQSNKSKTIWSNIYELSNQYAVAIYEADSLKHLVFRQRYNPSESNRLQGEYQRSKQRAEGIKVEP